MFSFKHSSALVLGLVLALGTACSGGNFLGQQGGNKSAPKKKAAPAVNEEGNIYTVEEIMQLPVEQYYVQTFLNIAGSVGDDEFSVDGLAFSDIASLYLGLVAEDLNNSDGTLTIGEKIEEAGLDPYAEVDHDEFIAALDTFQSLDKDAPAVELRLASGYALQGGSSLVPYSSTDCSKSGSSASGSSVQVGPGRSEGGCTNYGGVPVPPSYAANVSKAQAIAPVRAGQSVQGAAGAKSCGQAPGKSGYSTQVVGPDGNCISKVQAQFDEMASKDPGAACKNLEYLAGTFMAHAASCSTGGYACDPRKDASPNGVREGLENFKPGTNDQEYAIANYGMTESTRLLNSCKSL